MAEYYLLNNLFDKFVTSNIKHIICEYLFTVFNQLYLSKKLEVSIQKAVCPIKSAAYSLVANSQKTWTPFDITCPKFHVLCTVWDLILPPVPRSTYTLQRESRTRRGKCFLFWRQSFNKEILSNVLICNYLLVGILDWVKYMFHD